MVFRRSESLSHVWLFEIPWSGKPFPSPGDLPNPRIKPRSPALQADSLPAEPQGKSKNTGVGRLEWVTYPFSSRSFWPRNWTEVSCIAGRFFTCWATREASIILIYSYSNTLVPFLNSNSYHHYYYYFKHAISIPLM